MYMCIYIYIYIHIFIHKHVYMIHTQCLGAVWAPCWSAKHRIRKCGKVCSELACSLVAFI